MLINCYVWVSGLSRITVVPSLEFSKSIQLIGKSTHRGRSIWKRQMNYGENKNKVALFPTRFFLLLSSLLLLLLWGFYGVCGRAPWLCFSCLICEKTSFTVLIVVGRQWIKGWSTSDSALRAWPHVEPTIVYKRETDRQTETETKTKSDRERDRETERERER